MISKEIRDKFIEDLTKHLITENKYFNNSIKVPQIICAIDNYLWVNKYESLVSKIKDGKYCFETERQYDDEGYYMYKISIVFKNYRGTWYDITLYEFSKGNYCNCHPTDEGFNEEHQCCGNNCDFDYCGFNIEEIKTLGSSSYEGLQKDFWEYEKKLLFKFPELSRDYMEEQRKKNIIQIENEIKVLNEKLLKLKK